MKEEGMVAETVWVGVGVSRGGVGAIFAMMGASGSVDSIGDGRCGDGAGRGRLTTKDLELGGVLGQDIVHYDTWLKKHS